MNQDHKLYNDILEGREKRAERQQELISRYGKPLVSFSLNIPGPHKTSSHLEAVHQAGLEALEKKLKETNLPVVCRERSVSAAGHQAFLVVEADAGKLKRLTVEIEEQHFLGRLFDFDVFDDKYNQMGRAALGLPERTCLLCQDNVTLCRKSGRHSLGEVLQRMDEMIEEYLASFPIDS